MDGDGDVDGVYVPGAGYTAGDGLYTHSPYSIEVDLDRNGTYQGSLDPSWRWSNDGAVLQGGQITSSRSGFTVDNNVGYAGYRFDPETTNYHVRHRYYNPALGRWISRDPAGYVDGTSLYQYVMGNPVMYTDPWGLEAIPTRGDTYYARRHPEPPHRSAGGENERWVVTPIYENHHDEDGVFIGSSVTHSVDGTVLIDPEPTALNAEVGLRENKDKFFQEGIDATLEGTNEIATEYATAGAGGILGAIKALLCFGRAADDALRLADDVAEAADDDADAACQGKIVLGKYPDYINLADEIGAHRFHIAPDAWELLDTPAQQWEANRKFLDLAIERGDEIILSNKVPSKGASDQMCTLSFLEAARHIQQRFFDTSLVFDH